MMFEGENLFPYLKLSYTFVLVRKRLILIKEIYTTCKMIFITNIYKNIFLNHII